MLKFDNLSKRYEDRVLFQGLAYESGIGCIALEDDTGSGKSTLLRILAGEADADEGEIWLGGHSLAQVADEAKAVLAYVPEDYAEYPIETGRAFLEKVAASQRVSLSADTLALADAFGLTPHLDKRFEQMSFGTRKKFFFTATAIGKFSVVLADEPTSGLDGPSRKVLSELFKTLAKDRLVFFTSYDENLVRASEAKMIRFADMKPA
ncbi:ATP-binding cassette domain-containing protein [Pigmentiphaga aceris]|uniref:ATP-binding cassette domain-containing protein n=1 Tax=Pigmentiphaga aceris TaxID=1940612 RepID=A0A5C0B5W3_9BURK|nr:ATP-binding cassette domain-containing protein [Pigmentiphaga aceris]QEI09316.1 ATP-binding cassette domain-containing protein [Pigmentiphaga aceris]